MFSKAKVAGMLLALFTSGFALAQSPRDTVVEVSAVVQESPPEIALSWLPNAHPLANHKVYRHLKGESLWIPIATLSGAETGFTDTGVLPGINYEYYVSRTTTIPGQPIAGGYLSAGIRLREVERRGKVILLVDDTMSSPLANELSRFTSDLVGDGWIVLREDVPRSGSVTAVKAVIRGLYDLDPVNTRAVILFGHVPVPYSGDRNPDGHPDHRGAWPADVYYGEVNGSWTDSFVNNPNPARAENKNIPGDGKFDQSVIPNEIELEVGRIDLANMNGVSNGLGETELLRQYLNRNHDFRHAQGSFASVTRRGLIDDEFGYTSGEAFAATGWRNFTSFFGSAPGSIVEADWFSTLQTENYLCAYACGGGAFTGGGGIGLSSEFAARKSLAVFNILLGSYFGDWDNPDNLLRAPLAGRSDSLGLVSLWGGRPHWYIHHMAMGETVGYGARLTQNNTGVLTNGYISNTFPRGVHIGLMGDPTLRLHSVPPVTDLVADANSTTLTLRWTASSDSNVEGYAIYRATSSNGPFIHVDSTPIVDTEFTDITALAGVRYTYMVQAIKLETSAGGTYLNNSQGAFASGRVGALPFPEINISGNGQQISNGDVTISVADGSDFGQAEINDQSVTRSFTITNEGDSDLHLIGLPVVELSGNAAAEFSILNAPAGTVQPGGAVTFQVVFSPSVVGTRTATVTILNDDPDENPFAFAIGGIGVPSANVTVSPDAGPNGSISPSAPLVIAIGTGVTFTATPATGFLVDHWLVNGALAQSGGESFTLNNVTADSAVRVTFKAASPPTFTVTPTSTGGGVITPDTPVIIVSGGDMNFTATPASGFLVDQWLVNEAPAQTGGGSFTLTNVAADAAVRVTFKAAPPPTVIVTPASEAGGVISPDTLVVVNSGANVSFTATPESGFLVDQWLVNEALAQTGGGSFTLANVAADTAVRVTFKAAPPPTYTMTPTAGTGGAISPDTPLIISSGTDVNFTARPASGFLIDRWLVNEALAQTGGEAFTLNNVTGDTAVRVTFKAAPLPTFIVTPISGDGGAISPDAPLVVNSGAFVNFIATPTNGFFVHQWLVNGALAQSGGGSFTLGNVGADAAVQVTFKTAPHGPHVVTPTAGTGGAISPDTPMVVNNGTFVNFTAAPTSGLLVDHWLVNGTLAQAGGEIFTLTDITADVEVRVTFKRNPVSDFIPQSAGYTGMVSPSMRTNYTYGRVRFQTTRSGAVTGNALIDGHRYRFRGNLDVQGRLSRKLILKLNGRAYEHHLEILMTNDGSGFSGAFRRGAEATTRPVLGERNAEGTRNSPVAQSGRYTAIVGNLAQSVLGSPVRGFLSMRVAPTGAARIVGYLPDGRACSTGSHISVTEKIAVVAGLYLHKRGYLHGETSLATDGDFRDWNGELRWLKPLGASGIYGYGILDGGETLALDGALYQPPANKSRVLPAFDASTGIAAVALSGGDMPAEPEPISAVITRNNDLVVTQSNNHKLSIRINASTGCFRGSLVDAAGKRRLLRGAFVDGAQGAQRGEGFFVGKYEAGRVLIQPVK